MNDCGKNKKQLLDKSSQELEVEFFQNHLNKGDKYRLRQIYDWVFQSQASSFKEMSNLPEPFRQILEKNYFLRSLKIKKVEKSAVDRTSKFTFETVDLKNFTAVLLPRADYYSLCVSTQVGCAWKCQFCASGLVEFDRNLSSGEILDQIFLIQASEKIKIKNILFMGMGEPLANYENLVKTIRWLLHPQGFKINPDHVTLSTTGVVPQIKKIAQERLKVNLALSLHSADETVRKKIMPVSSKFSILETLHACKMYQLENDCDLTMEYILLDGINDGAKDSLKLVETLDSIPFKKLPKINLIPYNPIPNLPFKPSSENKIEAFFKFLKRKGFVVHTRRPQGQDIGAACGQLS